MSGDGETRSADEDVSQAGVRELKDSSLLAEIERDVFHVGLDLAKSEGELVMSLIPENGVSELMQAQILCYLLDDVVWTELDEVVRFNGDDVWEKVLSRQGQVLDDDVPRIVRVFDTGNGEISNLREGKHQSVAQTNTG